MSNNTDKLIPISYVKKFTPLVPDDELVDSDGRKATVKLIDIDFWNGMIAKDNDWYLVSFADRPNTGTQPVGDDVVVECIRMDDLPINFRTADCRWSVDNGYGPTNIRTWKPNHSAMLKQYQAEQVNKTELNDEQWDALQEAIAKPQKPSQELIDLLKKPVSFSCLGELTKPVSVHDKLDYKPWDGKESLDIGMGYTDGSGEDCMFIGIHAGIIIGRPMCMYCHNKLYLSTSDKTLCKPIDNRTPEEKLIDVMRDMNFNVDEIDDLLSSDKFTITLNN